MIWHISLIHKLPVTDWTLISNLILTEAKAVYKKQHNTKSADWLLTDALAHGEEKKHISECCFTWVCLSAMWVPCECHLSEIRVALFPFFLTKNKTMTPDFTEEDDNLPEDDGPVSEARCYTFPVTHSKASVTKLKKKLIMILSVMPVASIFLLFWALFLII